MTSPPLLSHPYCRRCGSIIPCLWDPGIQYDGELFHLSCAMRTILEKSLRPPGAEHPHQDAPKGPRF